MHEEEVVEEIKKFIESHLSEEITLKKISDAVCYSEEHTSRLFKKNTGENLFDFVRNRRLLAAADRLKREGGKIINIALDHGFNSHEVFTRAFSTYFGISPRRFRLLKPEIKQFMPKGLKVFPLERGENVMANFMIFTQILEKEERQLLFYPGKKATHYFEYCNELGCDVWGRLMEIEGTLDEPLGFWLPEKLRGESCSEYVQGVEVPLGFKGPVPEGIESMILPAGSFLIFQSEPYEESDEKMLEVIQSVQKGIASYNPELYGYVWAGEDAPRYQMTPLGERGYIEAVPVRRKG
ncbi:MAG: helix-turn-helix transcriptional regulator [Spirochaetales bacterium]|nr:helix-turn-helix transcriptional regulator [Spirochaetales bacterium]